jgi:DNA-binding transcriptional ArsR family regulator
MSGEPIIQWDFGTAYELFISLHVLHNPDHFGIRASWAAGVRSRIPASERKLLEDLYSLTGVPLGWIHSLPAPKDAITAIWALKQIPASERMIKMTGADKPCVEQDAESLAKHEQFNETFLRIASSGAWKPEDVDFVMKAIGKKTGSSLKRETVERVLDWWSRPDELGEGLLSALQSYYQAFFEEEEKRITPILKAGLENARAFSTRMTAEELFMELSQGVQLGEEFRAPKFVFAPAFWSTPLIMYEKLEADTQLIIFGARPANMSVVPGETVPDGLVRSLKALADPTRLKILFYLSRESLTPSELARRLHLRTPTVIHHLNDLRLASLVELSLEHEEKRYAVRAQALESTFGNLASFLHSDPAQNNE